MIVSTHLTQTYDSRRIHTSGVICRCALGYVTTSCVGHQPQVPVGSGQRESEHLGQKQGSRLR